MTIRLPSNPDNITQEHAERAINHARHLFDMYEKKVDFTWPKEKIDELYRPYQIAREQAIELARHTRWCIGEAEALP